MKIILIIDLVLLVASILSEIAKNIICLKMFPGSLVIIFFITLAFSGKITSILMFSWYKHIKRIFVGIRIATTIINLILFISLICHDILYSSIDDSKIYF